MKYAKYLILLMIMLGGLTVAKAQVSVGVGVGVGPVVETPVYVEPVCQWGYYPYYPYDCVPYGYYSSDWFIDGFFIGVGPWYGYHWHGRGYDRWCHSHYGWRDRDRWDHSHIWNHAPAPRGFNHPRDEHRSQGHGEGFHGGNNGFHGGGHQDGHNGHK